MIPIEPENAEDHVRGALEPEVTIIQYGDYDCPHTRRSQAVVARLLDENAGLRLVFRHFPLRHLHPFAEHLSRIAEAAHRAGQFWPAHERLMNRRGSFERSWLLGELSALSLFADTVDGLVEAPAIIARIERDVRSGRASGVHSVPSFFFNGQLHDGHYDYETLRGRVVQAARGSNFDGG